jgi:hypothetical protein
LLFVTLEVEGSTRQTETRPSGPSPSPRPLMLSYRSYFEESEAEGASNAFGRRHLSSGRVRKAKKGLKSVWIMIPRQIMRFPGGECRAMRLVGCVCMVGHSFGQF